MSIDEVPSETPPQRAHDFSNLQGLQIVGAHQGASEDQVSEAWREALKLELEARAARFHHAVDASIVLSDDGVIRWLGDPVARLAAGPDLLTPRALILADASLPDSARETVAARLELWLTATTRRLLGPLLALRSVEGESEPVRQIAAKIADALGILEREPVKTQIKVLDQNSRAVLRRHGVRFGAYYIYVPQSLKPAARALALQLWSLQMPEVSEEFVKTLLSLASSGRTSLPVNPLISRDGYRVAGFRPCGERVVRVDIVERLSDMIRAAFVACSSADASPPSTAFVVSGQMTSLTGCSGGAFASILRSLGYESFEIERSTLASPEAAVGTGQAPIRPTPALSPLGSKAERNIRSPGRPPTSERTRFLAQVAERKKGSQSWKGTRTKPSERSNRSPRRARPKRSISKSAGPHSSRRLSLRGGLLEDSDLRGQNDDIVGARPWPRPRLARMRAALRRPAPSPADNMREGNGDRAEVPVRRKKGFQRSNGSVSMAVTKSAVRPQPIRAGQAPALSSKSRRAATVDPNSPFAKLLELRSVLEKQGKNR